MQMTFLNNFYTLIRTQLFGNPYNIGYLATSSTDGSQDRKVLGNLKDVGGNDLSQVYYQPTTNGFGYFFNNNATNSTASMRFGVGSGRTAVSMSDYELAAPLTSGISISRTAATNVDGIVHNVIVRNDGNADITISEIGLYEQTSPNSKIVLIARAVLDSPVVIPAGESKTFDVSLSLATPA